LRKTIARNRRTRKRSADGASFFKQQGVKETPNFFSPSPVASFFQPTVQRAPDDKHDLTSTKLSGNTELEKTFDNERIVSKPSKGDHVKLLQEALIDLGFPLPKFGADSDYGGETVTAVKDFQKKAGMSEKDQDGIVGRKTIGLLDMSLRNNNTVSTDPDAVSDDLIVKDPKVKDDSCKDKSKDEPCDTRNKDIDQGAQDAIDLIDKVIKEQLPPKKDDKTDYPTIFSSIFRNNDSRDIGFKVTEVKNNYEAVQKFLGKIKTDKSHVRCATACDSGCRAGSPAYHHVENSKDIISFCPKYSTDPQRTVITLHECHHAAIPGSSDMAYQSTRLIDKLDHAKALLNAASFHVYAEFVLDPAKAFMGPKVKDTDSLKDASQKKQVELVLAFMEQWFKLVTFDMSEVSGAMDDAKAKGKYSNDIAEDMIDRFYVPWFKVTPTSLKPTANDIAKAKAIQERSETMETAFKSPFIISDAPTVSSWERGPGKEIKLNQALLKLNQERMAIALLQEIVHATPGISANLESWYVGLINGLRTNRDLDP